jgi:hypothetical protein
LPNADDVITRVPAFTTLMGGAFNQDWEDDWDSAQDVFEAVLSGFPEFRRQLLDDLRLVERSCSSEEIDALLLALGSGFSPEIDAGCGARDWVRQLIARIDASFAV